MNQIKKYNTVLHGLLPGILLPLLTLMILWQVSAEDSIVQYLKAFYIMKSLAGLISLCSVPNLLLFFIFIWTNRIKSARGVIIATLIMAGIMLVFKIF